jgi:hypothetical protein
MKRLMFLAVLATLLGGASGCHFGECWNYAWNSRFHPERNARLCQPPPCVVADPCGDPCAGGAVVTTPGCGCGTPLVTPGPIVTH